MLKENIERINSRIVKTCEKSGRLVSDVRLIAVSKQHPLEMIKGAIKYGISDFGENRSQEFKEKTASGLNINWHFIGHLQTNKVKDVVPNAYLIHSVDSEKIAKEINKRAERNNKIQNILIEVNTSGEENKFGISGLDDTKKLAEICKNLKYVNLLGLMTMAPFTKDENIIRSCFRTLKLFFDKLNDEGFVLSELSMGMTNDFEIAIEEGATLLRIGTAIFGSRNYGN